MLPAVTAIGDANVACCHPDAVSPLNVTVPNLVPVLVHKLPTCVPLFVELLWNRIPETNPSWAGRNLTPTSTDAVSESVRSGVAVDGQIVHGHEEGGGLATVVNDQLTGAIVLPAASLAPDTATLYTVLVANAADGVNVAVRLASL